MRRQWPRKFAEHHRRARSLEYPDYDIIISGKMQLAEELHVLEAERVRWCRFPRHLWFPCFFFVVFSSCLYDKQSDDWNVFLFFLAMHSTRVFTRSEKYESMVFLIEPCECLKNAIYLLVANVEDKLEFL